MQWKRIRHITSHDFFHGTLELLEPGVPVFLFMGEDECRALDERVRAFLTSGVTGDEDYVIIDTAEYAIPGLDDDFPRHRVPWILSVLTTDRLARNYELVTKHNLKVPSLLPPVRLLRVVAAIGLRNRASSLRGRPIFGSPLFMVGSTSASLVVLASER